MIARAEQPALLCQRDDGIDNQVYVVWQDSRQYVEAITRVLPLAIGEHFNKLSGCTDEACAASCWWYQCVERVGALVRLSLSIAEHTEQIGQDSYIPPDGVSANLLAALA